MQSATYVISVVYHDSKHLHQAYAKISETVFCNSQINKKAVL